MLLALAAPALVWATSGQDPQAVASPGGTISGGTTSNGNGPGGGNNGSGGGNGASPNPGHPITLTGTVVGVVRPGAPATLVVDVRNQNNQDILVTSVTGTVTSASRAGCDPAWYSVGTWSGSSTIRKNASGQVSVPLLLADLPTTNQDACKGATVQLAFTAQARQA